MKEIINGSNLKRLYFGGFAGICVMLASVVIMLFLKHQYPSGVSDVFNLSMDVLGMLVSLILYYGCYSSLNAHNKSVQLFLAMLSANALTLFLDGLMWFVSGDPSLVTINLIISVLFYISANLPVVLLGRYAAMVLYRDNVRPNRTDSVLNLTLGFVILVCLSNFFFPVMFTISPEGLWQKSNGYPLGYINILATFAVLVTRAYKAEISKARQIFIIAVALVPIITFLVTSSFPQLGISYTVAATATLMSGCMLFVERVRLKDLVTRIFALILLCAMLVYGPVIYIFSFNRASEEGFETANSVMMLMTRMLDETGLEKLSDPDNKELYQTTRNKFRELCRFFELQHMYVEHIDENGVRSFIIAAAASDDDDLVLRETLGWPGASVWSEKSRLTEPELLALKGEYTNQFSEENNTFGHNLDWFYPYKNSDGEVAALLGVDIAVEDHQIETIKNAIWSTIPLLMLYFITLLILLHVLDNTFLEPVNILSKYIQSFISGRNQTPDNYTLQGGYEIWLLSKSLDFMSRELDEYEEIVGNEIKEKQRSATEMDLAANIQAHYLPGVFPAFPDRNEFEIYASMHPAKEVGGDFYDFFLIDEDHLCMAVADVSGKGVPAALFMMISKTMLRTGTEPGYSPADVLEKVNAQLAKNNDLLMFVTVWLGILEISTGTLTFSDAGHEKLMLCRNNHWEMLPKRGGGPLAIFEPPVPFVPGQNTIYSNQSITLHPGDAIFQYTDGVTEATNDNKEMFGEDRMLAILNDAAIPGSEEAINRMRHEIDSFVGDAPQFDDITMLCLYYHGDSDRP